MAASDFVILGETHDNPEHHIKQAEIIAAIKPAAVVYEMLTPEQAILVTPERAAQPKVLRDVLNWDASGWPDFSLYAPVFAAYPPARVFGAQVPRHAAREVLSKGLAAVFGPGAADYGLTEALPEQQQQTREAMQMAAHCDALPVEMLPGMVAIQRLRDATLAQWAVRAYREAGAPVVIITGNGHARRDWGIPVYLARVLPEATLFVLGQAEDGAVPDGGFDAVLSAPAAERDDPCRAFRASD
ncbi:MAG: ChaN family lipoprotein [Arenibacterium sp.]